MTFACYKFCCLSTYKTTTDYCTVTIYFYCTC